MKRAHGGALLLSWAIGSAAFGTNACGSEVHSCTEIGCQTQEELAFSTPELTSTEANVEACRNAQCWQAHLQLDPAARRQSLRFGDDNHYDALLLFERQDVGSMVVTATFPVLDASDVARGDVLKVTFMAADGSELFAASGTTGTPKDSYPNGPDCDLSPCRQATAHAAEL